MSGENWELTVSSNVAKTLEAMVTFGKALLYVRKWTLFIGQAVSIGLCAPIGAKMTAWLIVVAAVGREFSKLPVSAFRKRLLQSALGSHAKLSS